MADDSLNVLIVEDDHLVSEMIRGMVEELGHSVTGVAEDGHEALEMIRQDPPQLVIMDIKMPRMSGIQASILIQKYFPTPVVILSAYRTRDLEQQAMEAGVGAYVEKPPKPDELSMAMKRSLDRFDDICRIRELKTELNRAEERIAKLSRLVPRCPGCGQIKTGEEYDARLAKYLSLLNDEERRMCLCRKCLESGL